MKLKKYTTILLVFSFIFLLIAITGFNYTKEYLEQINYATLKSKIENKQNFILYISNKSCSRCNEFEPKLRNVINKYRICVYKIDTTTMTNLEFTEFSDYTEEIDNPQVLFFYDGEESGITNRINGNIDEDSIMKKLATNKYIKD